MKRKTQSELIKQLTDRQVVTQLYLTQLLLLILSLAGSMIFFDSLRDWIGLFEWDLKEIMYYGGLAGLLILTVDVFLMMILPKRFYDDGGVNEKVFRNLSAIEILFLTFLVAFSEEMLFRGMLQTEFGYLPASLLFAIVHIRYLTKPVLFISVVAISFYIGWIFELTGNLWVTVLAHFTVDVVLGLMIRFQVLR